MSKKIALDRTVGKFFNEIESWRIRSFILTLFGMIALLVLTYFILLVTGFWGWFIPIEWGYLMSDHFWLFKGYIIFLCLFFAYAPIYLIAFGYSYYELQKKLAKIFDDYGDADELKNALNNDLSMFQFYDTFGGAYVSTNEPDGTFDKINFKPKPWITGSIIVILHLLAAIYMLITLVQDQDAMDALRAAGVI